MPQAAAETLVVNDQQTASDIAPLRGVSNPAIVENGDSDSITAAFWNVELNDADAEVVGQRIANFDGVDLWGISEVNQERAVVVFETAAEVGEGADYDSVFGTTGGGDRLLAIYDTDRFDLLSSDELDWINTTGNARAPLVLHLREQETDLEFLFMVNHLYRSRDEERHRQAQLLNEWADNQTLPVIAGGDYNFDWATVNGETDHDLGYDRLTADDEWIWIQPDALVTTQCSGWPCRYQSVLDFVFVAGDARDWRVESEIVVSEGDFPDDSTTSDHRPVVAYLWPGEPAPQIGYANHDANLRAGPGTSYPIVGRATAGQELTILGTNDAGDWLRLEDEAWIAAFLVDIDDGPPPSKATYLPIVLTNTGALVSPTPVSPMPVPPTPESPTPVPPTLAPTVEPGLPNEIIRTIFYDGLVPSVESDEYAVIANTGTAPANLAGWRLNADDQGQDFRFPAFELAPGQEVRVYTNEIHPESGGFSFGSGSAIWRNKGECGHLYDHSGTEVSTYCY